MFCVPIIAANTEEAIEKMAGASAVADMCEIRLDLMDSFDLPRIIRSSRIPTLVTYRSVREGGGGSADSATSAEYLISATQEGADLVDVELSMPNRWREKIFEARGESRIVISTHFNDHTPSRKDLKKIFKESVAAGADVVKIVTRAERWDDNLRVLGLIPEAQDQGIKVIAFCMGPVGRISRIFSYLMGAYLTFTSFDRGQESAAGQIPIMEMKRILEHFTL